MTFSSSRRPTPHWFNFSQEREISVSKEIKSSSKDYILNVNERDYVDFLINKYYLHPLNIDVSTENVKPPVKMERENYDERQRMQYSRYYYACEVTYNFEGDSDLWDVRPSTFSIGGANAEFKVFGKKITIYFTIEKQSPDEFLNGKNAGYQSLLSQIKFINTDIQRFNLDLRSRVENSFREIKNQYLSENDFFRAINVKINSDAPKFYNVPIAQKRPAIGKPGLNQYNYTFEPRIDQLSYEQILDTTWRTGISLEQKPSLYMGKSEEGIRDFFLTQLELGFEGGTVSGETFNHSGRTDILLKNNDGTNLFVGECKIWKGEKVFQDTISQLLSYLSWADSKTAMLFFVKNESLTKVIGNVKESVSKHSCYVKVIKSQERRFRVEFHLPQDVQKKVQMDIQLFHLDK